MDRECLSFNVKEPSCQTNYYTFFDQNGYYTVHADDAVFTAKEVFNTSILKYFEHTSGRFHMFVYLQWYMNQPLGLLLARQYKVKFILNDRANGISQRGSPGLQNFEQFIL